MPIWFWGLIGGLILGPIGLLILLPGCARGPLPLLQRFVISMLVKLLLAGVGFILALKLGHLPPFPLAFGFFIGYTFSLILEISLCLWKVRKCSPHGARIESVKS